MIVGLGIMTWMFIWVRNGTIDKDYFAPIEIHPGCVEPEVAP